MSAPTAESLYTTRYRYYALAVDRRGEWVLSRGATFRTARAHVVSEHLAAAGLSGAVGIGSIFFARGC